MFFINLRFTMRKKKIIVYIFFFLLKLQILVGQNAYEIENLKFSDGLPSDNVFFTTKKDGNLYVATQRGLSLYDGYRFVKNSHISNVTNFLFANNNNLHFYFNGKGLCYINSIFQKPQFISRVNYIDSIPNNDHYDNVYVDKNNNVWCSDQNNVKYFTNSKNYSFVIDHKSIDAVLNITFLESSTDEFIIATTKGVFVWDKKLNKVIMHSNAELAKAKIISAKRNENLICFITFEGKLLFYNSLTKKLSKINFDKNIAQSARFVANTKLLFVYDEKALYKYDILKNTKQIIYSTANKINHVFYDNELHLFWISTNRGLVKLSKSNDNITDLNLPEPKTVVSINQDSQATIWCVAKDNKIYSYTKNKQWKTYQFSDKKTEFEQLFFHENQLYAVANNGFYSLKNECLKLEIPSKIPFKKATIDHNKLLWIIPSKGAIRVYDALSFKEKTNYIHNNAAFWNENIFNDIAVAPNGKVWLASWIPKDYGICYFDTEKQLFVQINNLRHFKNGPNFITNYYNRISFTTNNNLIFSGYGGWNIVSPEGKITHSLNTALHKVVNDHIEGISQDTKGNIWFACAEGLNQYNFKTNKVVRISQIDGLATDELLYGFCKLSDNKIALGTHFGCQIVDLNTILKTQLVNKLQITVVKKDGEIIPHKNDKIQLNYDFTELEILFSSLSFSQREKIIYRYKFDTDKTWNYLGTDPKLSLVKLSSGEYNITIEAGDNIGNWQAKKLKIALSITPPFYKTLWFIGLVILLLFVLVYLISRYFINQEKIKGILKSDIKEAEMQTLRSQMNPHFMFNSLNSINSYIIQSKSNEASKYLTTFSKLMRNILDNSKHRTISLDKEIKTLDWYLQLEAVRLDHKFTYTISCSDDIDCETTQVPPLIMQPFLENAIWHGIQNKNGQGHITIQIDSDKTENLKISIIDDGIGRKASALLKKNKTTHKSHGIDITINRLHMLNQNNSVNIIDLYDENEQPLGTQILLTISY